MELNANVMVETGDKLVIEFPTEFDFTPLEDKEINCITHYSFTASFDFTMRGGQATGYTFGSPC